VADPFRVAKYLSGRGAYMDVGGRAMHGAIVECPRTLTSFQRQVLVITKTPFMFR